MSDYYLKKGDVILPQTIYADVLFFINFSMDFLALYITSRFLKIRIKNLNTVIAALLGAFYSVFTVVLYFDNLLVSLLFGYIMCFIVFGKHKLRGTAYIFVTYIAVNFLLGGGMTAVFTLFNSVVGERLINIYGNVTDVPERLPLNVFAVGVFVISAVILTFCKVFSRKGTARRISVNIKFGSKTENMHLLEDSGNSLCEPISGDPVIFLSEKSMSRLFNEKTLQGLKNFSPDEMISIGYKTRIAVYETVSGRDMCLCVKPDRITVNGKEVRAWISFAKNVSFGDGDGIVPSVIINE